MIASQLIHLITLSTSWPSPPVTDFAKLIKLAAETSSSFSSTDFTKVGVTTFNKIFFQDFNNVDYFTVSQAKFIINNVKNCVMPLH